MCATCVACDKVALDGVRWSKVRAACVACGKVTFDGVMVDGSRWSECGEEARVWCWRIIDQELRESLDNQIGRSNSRGSKTNASFTHEGEIVQDMCEK